MILSTQPGMRRGNSKWDHGRILPVSCTQASTYHALDNKTILVADRDRIVLHLLDRVQHVATYQIDCLGIFEVEPDISAVRRN